MAKPIYTASNLPAARPFLKWAGGKTQLLGELSLRLPTTIETYYEPFAGSAALFFFLARHNRFEQAILADTNAELIRTFQAIQSDHAAVSNLLGEMPHTEEFFYSLRTQDPRQMSDSQCAARMIYLNKTCFNGLYRVNSKGQFNVPFGRYKKPKYYDPENLAAVAQALRHVQLRQQSFETAVQDAPPGAVVYFDPPYVPLSKTASFTSYQSGGFGLAEQVQLRETVDALTQRGIYVLVSNSDSPNVHDLYNNYEIHLVRANRAINSKADGRGKINEVLITNRNRLSKSKLYVIDHTEQLRLLEQSRHLAYG